MSRPPLVKIWTDASHHDGVAGLAGWIRDRGGDRVLFMDVVLSTSSGIAERLALERAMTIARRAHWRRVCFYTDAKKCWRGIPTKREDGWDIHWVPRRENQQANVVSREVRQLWEAWNRGEGTIPNTPRPAAPPEQNRMVAPPAGEAPSIVSSMRVDTVRSRPPVVLIPQTPSIHIRVGGRP